MGLRWGYDGASKGIKGKQPSITVSRPSRRRLTALLPVIPSVHFPFVDAGSKVARELNHQPQGGRLDRGKAHCAPLVLGNRISLSGRDRFPVASGQVFDPPRGGQPALAPATVVKPIDPRAAGLQRFPNAIFFGGQLVFRKDTFFTRFLHNYAVFSLQRRFYQQGLPLLILPIRV
jgi:hypothetical protein